jgi:hypothetical protein
MAKLGTVIFCTEEEAVGGFSIEADGGLLYGVVTPDGKFYPIAVNDAGDSVFMPPGSIDLEAIATD